MCKLHTFFEGKIDTILIMKTTDNKAEKRWWHGRDNEFLVKKIVNGKDFPKILETNKDAFEELPVSEYLRRLCEERDIVPEQVIKKAQIDRTYGHQILMGHEFHHGIN